MPLIFLALDLCVLTPPPRLSSARPRLLDAFSVLGEDAQRGGEDQRSRGCQLTSAFQSMGVSSSHNHDNGCWSCCLQSSHEETGVGMQEIPLLDWLGGQNVSSATPTQRSGPQTSNSSIYTQSVSQSPKDPPLVTSVCVSVCVGGAQVAKNTLELWIIQPPLLGAGINGTLRNTFAFKFSPTPSSFCRSP